VSFSRFGIGGIGVSIDSTKLTERPSLVPALAVLPGQVEGPVGVLPSLVVASRQ
jgi:hypothetical protein